MVAQYTAAVRRPGRAALILIGIGLFLLLADLRQPYLGGFFLAIGTLWVAVAVRRAGIPSNTVIACAGCQRTLDGSASFCPYCGRPTNRPPG